VKTFDLLPRPLIYLITKGEMTAANYSAKKKETLETIKIAVENKISLIQIREKQLSARLVFELVQAAAQITKNSFTKLLVNDRADIALAARADGVHLTEKSLRAEVVRHVFPKDFIIGVSAHTLETALEAKKQKADFVVYSPIFQAPQKSAPQGLKKLRRSLRKSKAVSHYRFGRNKRSELPIGFEYCRRICGDSFFERCGKFAKIKPGISFVNINTQKITSYKKWTNPKSVIQNRKSA
jgi:thiamine-phosphate diphosphorylase